ncbi:unnamed protein product [Lactuca saligna]|uniref:Potassium channel n=1 Tax=Lactuca saligna TaxID=75948 RepID=A0AA36DZF3_LACSI|nr:unnamed protein product [Lactuca saligna]
MDLKRISISKPQSSFGEVSILCNIPQPYTVRVCELCRLLRLDKQSFSNILEIYFHYGRKILNNLVEIDDAGWFLCTSVARGDIDYIRRILSNGVDPNSKDYDFRTPLHMAASQGSYIIVNLLVEAGASVLSKDRWGNTPLDEGRMSGNKMQVIKTAAEQLKLERYDTCCIVIEDAGKILDVDMILDGQKLYLISEE